MESESMIEQPIPPIDGSGSVEIACEGGTRAAPAATHAFCPGLAVTMANFGEFRVTHLASGRVIGGVYERWGSAFLEMVEWSAIARDMGFSWEEPDGKALAAALKAGDTRPVPFSECTATDASGTRPLTVVEWVQLVRGNAVWDEFPWESPDESPGSRAWALLKAMATTPTAPQGATQEGEHEAE